MTITLTREEAQQVLDALDYVGYVYTTAEEDIKVEKVIETLRTRLAQSEPNVSYAGNGTAGTHNETKPTGFFFQMPKPEPEPVAGKEYYAKLCERIAKTWKDNDANLPPELKLPWLSAEECAVAIRTSKEDCNG